MTLVELLRDALGANFHDLRGTLPTNGRFPAADSHKMPYLVIHHDEGPRERTVQEMAHAQVVQDGWWELGYHFIVRLGELFYVGEVDTQRAHIRDRNHEALGVGVTGEYGTQAVAPEDVAVLQALVRALDRFYGHEKRVVGHRDLLPPHEIACPGDQMQAVVAGLRPPPEPVDDRLVQLLMPWVSQLGPGAEFGTGDCGLTCVTAQVRAVTKRAISVDRVCQSVGLSRGFTAANIITHVRQAASNFGLTLKYASRLTVGDIERELLDQRPVILLVHYPRLLKRFDRTYSEGHFITITGMTKKEFIYDDPYWPQQGEGEDIRIPKQSLLDAAWTTVTFRTPGQGLLLRSHQMPKLALGGRGLDDEGDEGARDLDERRPGATLRGTVRRAGQPIANASLRLFAEPALLADAPGALLVPPAGAVAWSRLLTGFRGTRWDCWVGFVRDATAMPFRTFMEQLLLFNPELEADGFVFQKEKDYLLPEAAHAVAWSRPVSGVSGTRWQSYVDHVQDEVRGLTAMEFIQQVVVENPSLAARPIFAPERTYRFPENLVAPPQIAWARPLAGFLGSRWDAWSAFVRDEVEGISWPEFVGEVLEHNPTLGGQDRRIFRREQRYVLPHNVATSQAVLLAWTDEAGTYQFAGLRPGRYELQIQVVGEPMRREWLRIRERDVTHDEGYAELRREQPIVSGPDRSGVVQARGGDFVLDDKPFRFVGVNLRGLAHYGDSRVLRASQPGDRDVQLSAAQAMGARVVRLFLPHRAVSTEETAQRFEQLLDHLQQRGMVAIAALCDVHGDTGFNPSGVERFYSDDGMLSRDFYEGGFRAEYLPFVEALVQRCKGHRALMAWELGNEFKPKAGHQVLPELLIPFAREVGARIRALDPVHLIATGIINSGSLGCSPEQARRLNSLPTVDFLVAHIYEGVPDPGSQADWLENQRVELARAEQEAALARELGKPFIIEEIGVCGGDRVAKTRDHLTRWYDQQRVAACLPWGLMATGHDNGDGDNTFGIDRQRNRSDFDGLIATFRQRASAV